MGGCAGCTEDCDQEAPETIEPDEDKWGDDCKSCGDDCDCDDDCDACSK